MQPKREELLRRIGFSWDAVDPRHVPFHVRIQQLTEFKEEHGHCKVPTKCDGPYKKLGIWVDRQRQQYKNLKATTEEAGIKAEPGKKIRVTSITAEEIRCLEELGFEWEVARGGRGPNTGPRNSGHTAEGEIEKLVKTPENLVLDDISLPEPIQFSERSQEIIAREHQNKSRETLLSGLTTSNGAGPDFGSDNSNPKMGDSSKNEKLQQESIPEKKQIDRRNTVSNSDSEEKNHTVIEDENFGHISHVVPKNVTAEFLSGLDDMAPDLKNSLRSTNRRSNSGLSLATESMQSMSIGTIGTLGSSRMSMASAAQFDNEGGGDVVIMAETESSSAPSRDFMKLRVEQKKKALARRDALSSH